MSGCGTKWLTRIATGVLAVAVLLVALFLVAAHLHGVDFELYWRTPATVLEDGQPRLDAHVFRGRKGHILLSLPIWNRTNSEIYFPEYNMVADCNTGTFLDLRILGIQMHDSDGVYPCAGPGKQELTPEVSMTETSLAFYQRDWRAEPSLIRKVEIRWR